MCEENFKLIMHEQSPTKSPRQWLKFAAPESPGTAKGAWRRLGTGRGAWKTVVIVPSPTDVGQ